MVKNNRKACRTPHKCLWQRFCQKQLVPICTVLETLSRDFPLMRGKSQILSWSHHRNLLRVSDKKARNWYKKEAINKVWSVKTLDRNISTQYYERRLASQRDDSLTMPTPNNSTDPLEYIKNPMVAEFIPPFLFHLSVFSFNLSHSMPTHRRDKKVVLSNIKTQNLS